MLGVITGGNWMKELFLTISYKSTIILKTFLKAVKRQ